MAHTAKHLVLALTTATLFATPFAEAAKFGGGKSSGMQRSASPARSQQAAAPQYSRPATPAPAAAPARPGVGVGTAIAAGVGGAAAGYMLGSAMNSGNGNHSGAAPAAAGSTAAATAAPAGVAAPAAAGMPTAPQQQSGGMPWGFIFLLLLLGGGFWWMKRRKAEQQPRAAMNTGFRPVEKTISDDSNSYRNTPMPVAGGAVGSLAASAAAPLATNGRLPDGTEVPHFWRQAKATFMHLQSANTPQNVEEVRKYLTPEMFESIKADVSSNNEPADFPTLNCDLVEAEEEGNRLIASVRFHGMVSESVNAPIEPFSEVWHYVKGADTGNKWLVAGIQQG